MQCSEYDSPAFITSLRNAPYSSSLATSASASSASVWSDASSQSSDDTSISAPTSDSDSCESYCYTRPALSQAYQVSCEPLVKLTNPWIKQQTQQQQSQVEVPAELRQNPRRTSKSGCPPSLVRQADRKVNFVDNLVDSSTQIVEAIWPTSSVVCRTEAGSNGVLPLRTFIQETLRRSRTSYSTLQVALYYLILIKPHVPDHDFTMEQPDDCHASRVLQCGRRMFLAALILASKYLQDRNYSARAWSKISGLNTQEINQNEMAFLLAVNWKLHITDEVYNRWTDCVMKHTPSQPPSPGGAAQLKFERECEDFKNIVLRLTPDLDNLDEVIPSNPTKALIQEKSVVSPRSLFAAGQEKPCAFGYDSSEVTPTPKSFGTPNIMEPSPASVYTPGRLAPCLGLLPTPRLTPQTSGFSTPAVSAASYMLGKGSSMGFAMAQAGNVNAVQNMDKWPVSMTSSPQSYFCVRRSSLANSISTASSPESMVSDTSRTSRSSSISSASSLASAPSTKLDVQARCRYAKLCSERYSLRTTIASVPEDYEENCITSSPDSYTGPVGKEFCDMSLDTPLAKRDHEMDDTARDNDAARALQELHNNYHRSIAMQVPVSAAKAGSKRSRPVSMDNSNVQDCVRDMLNGSYPTMEASWTDSLVRSRASLRDSRKRMCCSTEASQQYNMSSLHPAMGGLGGPGMWEGILN